MTSTKDFDRWMAQAKEIDALQAENIRLREQAEALATALEHACSGQLSKVEWARVVDEADTALRAYREATHE